MSVLSYYDSDDGRDTLHSKWRFSMFLHFLNILYHHSLKIFSYFLYHPTHLLFYFLRFDTDDTLGALFSFLFPLELWMPFPSLIHWCAGAWNRWMVDEQIVL